MKTAMEIRNAQSSRKNQIMMQADFAALKFVDDFTESLFNYCGNEHINENKKLVPFPDYPMNDDCEIYFRNEFEKSVCARFIQNGFEIVYHPHAEFEISW